MSAPAAPAKLTMLDLIRRDELVRVLVQLSKVNENIQKRVQREIAIMLKYFLTMGQINNLHMSVVSNPQDYGHFMHAALISWNLKEASASWTNNFNMIELLLAKAVQLTDPTSGGSVENFLKIVPQLDLLQMKINKSLPKKSKVALMPQFAQKSYAEASKALIKHYWPGMHNPAPPRTPEEEEIHHSLQKRQQLQPPQPQ